MCQNIELLLTMDVQKYLVLKVLHAMNGQKGCGDIYIEVLP